MPLPDNALPQQMPLLYHKPNPNQMPLPTHASLLSMSNLPIPFTPHSPIPSLNLKVSINFLKWKWFARKRFCKSANVQTWQAWNQGFYACLNKGGEVPLKIRLTSLLVHCFQKICLELYDSTDASICYGSPKIFTCNSQKGSSESYKSSKMIAQNVNCKQRAFARRKQFKAN